MDQREMEILGRLLQRANPPAILHRYRRPSEHTLQEINEHRVFAAMPNDLNDPFEYGAPISIDVTALRKTFIEDFAPARGISAEQAAREFDASAESLPRKLRAGL